MCQRKFQTSDMKNNYDIGCYLYSGLLKSTLIAVEAETGLEREKETCDLHENLENIFRLRSSVSLIFANFRYTPYKAFLACKLFTRRNSSNRTAEGGKKLGGIAMNTKNAGL